MLTAMLVALAGAAGVLARYGLSAVAHGDAALWTTLAINVVGSFLLGLLVSADIGDAQARAVVGTGFLGGFTTYSTFSLQASQALFAGRVPIALLYVGASVLLGVGAAVVGHWLGRSMR